MRLRNDRELHARKKSILGEKEDCLKLHRMIEKQTNQHTKCALALMYDTLMDEENKDRRRCQGCSEMRWIDIGIKILIGKA